MPSINEIANTTGFSREAISMRKKRWGLDRELTYKGVVQLIPLDESHAERMSLEETRTDLASEQVRRAKMDADVMEGELATSIQCQYKTLIRVSLA